MVLKTEDKVVLICDYREKDLIEILKKLGANIKEMNLKCGDFICSKRIAIERKRHEDFISSVIDGRVFEQAKALRESFEKPLMIIEGFSNREINENALKAALASLIVDYNISLITTKNPLDTAKTIYWIAEKEQQENKYELAFKVGKKPKDDKKIKEFIVASIPGISTKLSKRLLEYFGSVEKIFLASEVELRKVKGIGKELAKKIKRILTEKY